ncbi:MAG: hypothetical protein GX851_04665 [Clostridiales bacterium]|nr:hypothetical protein [Clostridiales bacterium]
MDAIIYTSESGFTKKYAEILKEKTGLDAYELKDIRSSPVKQGSSVVYLGWLMAGGIKGYKKAAKMFDVRAVCAVGMSAPDMQPPETVKKQNAIGDIPVFYLQGGFDITKLHGMYKFMMNAMAKSVGKKLEEKAEKTEQEKDMLDMMKNGGDRVNADNLTEIIEFIKK